MRQGFWSPPPPHPPPTHTARARHLVSYSPHICLALPPTHPPVTNTYVNKTIFHCRDHRPRGAGRHPGLERALWRPGALHRLGRDGGALRRAQHGVAAAPAALSHAPGAGQLEVWVGRGLPCLQAGVMAFRVGTITGPSRSDGCPSAGRNMEVRVGRGLSRPPAGVMAALQQGKKWKCGSGGDYHTCKQE